MLPVSLSFVLHVAGRTLIQVPLAPLPSENTQGIETPEAYFPMNIKIHEQTALLHIGIFRKSSFINQADLKVFRGNVSVLISILFGQ